MVKIAFIQQGIYESLGVMYLSSYLKKGGHEIRVFIDSAEKELADKLKAYNPEIVCFSVISGTHLWTYQKAAEVKKILPHSLILLGGPHATFFPESIANKNIDIICVGEGEEAMLELANAFPDREKIKQIANLYVKIDGQIYKNNVRSFIDNLDLFPFPDRGIYYQYPVLRDAKRKTFLTTRGCPYNCSFCFNHQFRKIYQGKGQPVRIRSADNVIAEILAVKEKYGLESVFIQDDTFILNKLWLNDFLKKYKEQVNLPFTCLVRADLTDEDVVIWLKKAGCVGVQFGIESGDEEIRNKILRKNLTDEQIIKAAGWYKQHGIKFKTYNILGLPYESLESAFKTVELNARIKADLPWASILIPYPKTDIAEMMRAQGMIPENYNINDVESSFFDKKVKTKKEEMILNLQRLFFWSVKFPLIFPLVKKIIKFPPNFIFDGLFYLGELYVYKISENVGWMTSIKMGYNFVKLNLLKSKKDL